MAEFTLVFGPAGDVRFIHTEEAAAFVRKIAPTVTSRASHVLVDEEEPSEDGRWHRFWGDMGPSGGPLLGPFDTRAEAIVAEVAWLEAAGVPVPQA